MTDGGTIGEIDENLNSSVLYWKIKNWTSLSRDGDFFWSPEIGRLDNVWKLRIYPNGTNTDPGSITVQVWRTNVSDAKPFRFSLGIYKDGDSAAKHFEYDITRNGRLESDTSFCSGLFKFMRKDFVSDEWYDFSFTAEVTITFMIWIGERTFMRGPLLVPTASMRKEATAVSAGQEDGAHYGRKDDDPALRQHLEDMLLTGDDHDVTIKVKDKQFRAHKNMLRTRSPVFSAMFEHQMKESADDSISIEDCDPETFGEFLRYVYTGRVKNLSLSNAMELYYAGDKYDFSCLKKLCIKFLKASLSTTVIGDVISLALKHSEDELLDCAISFFSKHLEEILSSVEWQRFLLENPIRANEICLKAVKCRLRKN